MSRLDRSISPAPCLLALGSSGQTVPRHGCSPRNIPSTGILAILLANKGGSQQAECVLFTTHGTLQALVNLPHPVLTEPEGQCGDRQGCRS